MLELLIYFTLAYLIVRFAIKSFFSAMEHEQVKMQLMEHADRMIRIVQLEPMPEHGTILAYDKENNEFLGQGASEVEIKENIMKRFPEKVFLLNDKAFTAKNDIKVKIENIESSTAR